MESTSDNNKTIKKNETENKPASEGFKETLKPADDSFKTSPRKHRLSWETPHDEQMLDSQSLSEKDEGGD